MIHNNKLQKTTILMAMSVLYLLPLNCIADTTRDHRVAKESKVRDHRTTSTNNVRDHRTKNTGNVRDHRNDKQIKQDLTFRIPKNMQKKTPVIQWVMRASKKGHPILSGKHYQLVNMANNLGIKREKRTTAANLGFLSASSKNFNVLIKKQRGRGQVRYGDTVALNLKPYGWLRYKKQRHGINLSDDDHKPHYIWQIRGGEKGTKLLSGMPFALYNTKIKSETIFCKRTYGIDLGWYGKSKCNTFSSRLSGKLFGDNGLLSPKNTFAPQTLTKMKSHICKTAITIAKTAAIQTKNTPAKSVTKAASIAIKECKNF